MIPKLTKIIATIGPVTDTEEMIEKLILAGVNIFRFNFKHNTVEWHNERIQRVNSVAQRMAVPVGTLIDLQGPEIRINMPRDEVDLKKGDYIIFGPEAFSSTEKGFSISHPEIIPHLTEGQQLLADDGTFRFKVAKKDNTYYLESLSDGILKNRKSLNIPGAKFPFPVLVDRDFEGLQLASISEIDYVALSFVRTANDLKVVREEMKKFKVGGKLVAKIETQMAIDNLDEIISESDALMVARGDLGVELPIEQVPYYQKVIIKKCIEQGIPVITATQMLQSMTDSPYPTRAEVSDIANACFDLTDAVMLSGETASGKYPLEAVNSMNSTVIFTEHKIEEDPRLKFQYQITDQEQVVCDAAYNLYRKSLHEDVAAFVIFTKSGRTARLLSRYRPKVPVFAITPNTQVAESLTINYGLFPLLEETIEADNSKVERESLLRTILYLQNKKLLVKGKKVIVLHGDIWGVVGGTSTIKLVTV